MPVSTLGLGIESSCDETGVALVADGRHILANPLYSQVAMHAAYGGVIPETASRAHLEKMPSLIRAALAAIPDQTRLDYVAVTVRPGLTGSLLIGYNAALAIARQTGAQLIPVHHLEAHLCAVYLQRDFDDREIEWPAMGALFSGGNSAVYSWDAPGQIRVVGETIDDAVGEALDKAASLLGLPYPGGPQIEKAAERYMASDHYDPEKSAALNPLPLIMRDTPRDEVVFSFSGIKTALRYLLQKHPGKYDVDFLAWCFQERCMESIGRNITHALRILPHRTVVVAGGVTANKRLRSELASRLRDREMLIPPPALCTDNGAMIAAAGYQYFKSGTPARARYVSSDRSFDLITPERPPNYH